MYLIAVINQKGGVGKTTISINLAHAIQNDGEKVILIDADPQASTRDWNDKSDLGILPVVGMDRPSLPRDLPLIGDFDWGIIDGAPRHQTLAAAAVSVADLILIPVHPSPYDVWACEPLVELIKASQLTRDGRPKAAFVISKKIKNTKLSEDVRDALKGYELPIFKNSTTQRVVYPTSAAEGKTVFLADNPAAIEEINALKDEIKKYVLHGELIKDKEDEKVEEVAHGH